MKTFPALSFAAAMALGSALLLPTTAFATPLPAVVGSDTITFIAVSATPAGPVTGATEFTWVTGITSAIGTQDLNLIPVGTSVSGATTFYPMTALGEPASAFSFTINGYGTFVETGAPVLQSGGVTGTSSSVAYYLLGTFTPDAAGPLDIYGSNSASFDVQFVENGTYGGGPITEPAAGDTPEPSSLILLGTGLAGLAGAARRKIRS